MSAPELRIRQMHNRYHVCDRDEADRLQRQLDRMVRDRLPVVLDRSIGGLYQRLGLNADCHIVVRGLNIRIALGDFPDAAETGLIDHIAESWGRALVSGLERILSATGFTPGQVVVTDTFALFPDLLSARVQQILQLVRNAAEPWWSRALPGADGDGRALPQRLIDLAAREPTSAARCIVELALDPGPVWLTTIDGRALATAAGALIAATGVGGDAVDGGGEWRDDSVSLASLSASQRDQLRRCADGDSASLLYAAFRLLRQRPVMADYGLLKRRLEQGLALTPSLGESEPPESGVRFLVPEGVGVKDSGKLNQELLEQALDAAAMSMDRETEGLSEPASSARDPSERTMTETTAVPVGCGGLLFMIRFALRAWRRDGDPNRAMLALGGLALSSVFDRLPPAACRAAWQRDRGLLQVFAGLNQPPGEVGELSHPDSALSWARDVIEVISAHINDDVAPAPRGSDYLFGRTDVALSVLDRLLLRPGRLWVTEREARLILPGDGVDMGLRRGGWDIDPGWVPQLGRIIRFEYRES
jgi:hypothetical protein